MNLLRSAFLAHGPILLLVACADSGAAGRDDFIRMASDRAVVFESVEPSSPSDDLAPLREIVGDARIVALGESRHDLHEQFLMKSRFVRFLVEEMGFTALALEEGLPYGAVLDRYVMGGEGEGGSVLAGTGGWFAWDTEEILELVEWLRAWNEDAPDNRKVRLFGCDVGYPRLGLEEALAYMEEVDPEYADTIAAASLGLDLFHDWMWENSRGAFGRLAGTERDEIVSNLAALASRLEERKDEYVAASDLSRWEWAHRYAVVAREGARVFAAQSREEAGIIRDAAMAANLEWYLQEIAPGARAVLWAHNAHVLEDTFYIPTMTQEPLTPMGAHLARTFGDAYFSVGFTFEKGRFERLKQDGVRIFEAVDPRTLDGALAAAGPDLFLVDLRPVTAGTPLAGWLFRHHRMQGQQFMMRLRPSRAFDALFFVRDITRTRMNPGALERFYSIRGGP